MEKIKVKQLVDCSENQPELIFIPSATDALNDISIEGVMVVVNSWSSNDGENYIIPCDISLISSIYIKWDGCSHWWMFGQDYDGIDEKEKDACYHICGFSYYLKFMRAMMFGFQLTVNKSGDRMDKDEVRYFEEHKKDSKLLDGYRIEEVEYDSRSEIFNKMKSLMNK